MKANKVVVLAMLSVALAACGGSSGSGNSTNTPDNSSGNNTGGNNDGGNTGGNNDGGNTGGTTTPTVNLAINIAPTSAQFWDVTFNMPFMDADENSIGAGNAMWNQNSASSSSQNPILSSTTLTAGQVIEYYFNLTASGHGADLTCFTTDTKDTSGETYRYSRTLTAGVNTINVDCQWRTSLPITINGLPAGQEVELTLGYTERVDSDSFGVQRNIVHTFTGTGSVINGEYYADPYQSPWALRTDAAQNAGQKILGGPITASVSTDSDAFSCNTDATYTLTNATGRSSLVIDCEQTKYILSTRAKAFDVNYSWTPSADQKMGSSLAMSVDGNWMVAGIKDTGNPNLKPTINTTVYLFKRNDNNWEAFAPLTRSNVSHSNSGFGESVAIAVKADGFPLIAVGVPSSDQGNLALFESGQVLLFNFYGSNSYDVEPFEISASFSHQRSYFGSSIALSADGKYLAVGSPEDALDFSGTSVTTYANAAAHVWPNSTTATKAGAVYVFQLFDTGAIASNSSRQIGLIKPNGDVVGAAHFGASVAFNHDATYLLVGAPGDRTPISGTNTVMPLVAGATPASGTPVATEVGAASLFSRDTSTNAWTERAYIKPQISGTEPNRFGNLVALSNVGGWLNLAIGEENARFSLTNTTSTVGRVVVYRTENTLGNGTDLFNLNPIWQLVGGNYALSSIALAQNAQKLAVGQINPAGSGASSESGRVTVTTLAENMFGQPIFDTSTQRTVLRPTLSGNSTNGTSPESNLGQFGAGVALSGDGSRLAVGANTESCAMAFPPTINPITCGTWSDNSETGSVYLFD